MTKELFRKAFEAGVEYQKQFESKLSETYDKPDFETWFKQNYGNTVLAVSGNDLNQLIFAIAYTLEAIDVRATDPRAFEAKEKAAKIIEKLSSRVYQNEGQDKAGE